MSILTCVIGILTLMISASLITQEEAQENVSDEDIARAEANLLAKNKIKEHQHALKLAEAEVAKKNKSAQQLQQLRDKKNKLKLSLEQLSRPTTTPKQLEANIAKLTQSLKNLKKRKDQQSAQVEKINKEITRREKLPKPKERIQIRKGSATASQAGNLYFVECHKGKIQLYKNGKKAETISEDDIENSPVYKNFLKRIKDTGARSTVIFLVRRGSWNSYLWAVSVAEKGYQLQTGKLAVPGNGDIDLSKT